MSAEGFWTDQKIEKLEKDSFKHFQQAVCLDKARNQRVSNKRRFVSIKLILFNVTSCLYHTIVHTEVITLL